MPLFTKQRDAFTQGSPTKETIDTLTVGIVVDTNDPQQMGRVRAVCPQWGDSYNNPVEDLPWASYVSPFGGQVSVGSRGPGTDESVGGVSYGMWAIPKVAAQVIVMCIDGDPRLRVYMGCIFTQLTPHTMPHGRYMYDDHPGLNNTGAAPHPQGPFTSREHTIEPLTTNLQTAFGDKGDPNYEWRTRAADYAAAGLGVDQLSSTYSAVPDDKGVVYEGWTSTQGYAQSRIDPDGTSSYTDKNYDSMVYSFTTPGFHAFSMDDRVENCRVKFRTTSGHQILLDDTNERIYIATAQGNNWIEMDQAGNVDIYSNRLSVRSKNINFTADETIRMFAGTGIHMVSQGSISLDAQLDINVKTPQNVRINATQDLSLQSGNDFNILSGHALNLSTGQPININAGGNLMLTSGADVQINGNTNVLITAGSGIASMGAGGVVIINGASVDIEGSPAIPAGTAGTASASSAAAGLWTDRVPDHEPWARTMTADDTTHNPEFPYDDSSVNRVERGISIIRGAFWRR